MPKRKNKSLFTKSKGRIIAVIMGMLTLIFIGTIATILFSTWNSVYKGNQRILERFTESVIEGRGPKGVPKGKTDEDESAIMYMTVFSKNMDVIRIMNDVKPIMSDEELVVLSKKLVTAGKQEGIGKNYVFRITETSSEEVYVTLMDNRLLSESMTVLLKNTIIFGLIAIFIMFGISYLLADMIVKPMETAYSNQKQFIADAGHELKTPVSAINANAELLKNDIGPNRWLENIIFENKRMQELVTQLLELARTENTEPVMSDVDFSHLVEGCVLPFEAALFEKGFKLETEIEPGLYLSGDRTRLEQMVSNLVDNAVSHAEPANENKSVSISLKNKGKSFVLKISNPGKTISGEDLDKLFERFYRSDSSRELNGHYGLGLAIAKAVTESHNGKISVESKDNLTTFTVWLPT